MDGRKRGEAGRRETVNSLQRGDKRAKGEEIKDGQTEGKKKRKRCIKDEERMRGEGKEGKGTDAKGMRERWPEAEGK